MAELARIAPAGLAAPVCTETSTGGLRARRFGLAVPAPEAAQRRFANTVPGGGAKVARARAPTGPRAGGRAVPTPWDHAAGTSYPRLRELLVQGPLSTATREHALALLNLLAQAEASVHGTTVDHVHFHELADWDSLLDIVAAGSIAAQLEGARWTSSSLPIGGGTVRTEHGLLPVPAPATARLLEGYRWHDDGVAGERITPTGAAILRHLVAPSDCGVGREGGVMLGTGHGAGSRALPGLPNIVRVMVVQRLADATARQVEERDRTRAPSLDAPAHADFAARDRVATLEFDIDDMTGEEIALAAEHLRAQAGVVDVSIGTRFGKKGRTVADFRVMAKPEHLEAVARACFSETTTLGLRMRDEARLVLARRETVEEVEGAKVRVKVADRPGDSVTAKAEHDDIQRQRGLGERRRLRSAAARSALKRRPG